MVPALIFQLFFYVVSFLVVWLGSGLVVSAITDLAKSWKLPAFTLSFFVLGLLTSLPEITIGTIAIVNNDPDIVAGNLIGGIIVIFLAIIPLLGLLGGGVKMPAELGKRQLIMTLLVVLAPSFMIADQKLSEWEGLFLVLMYLSLFFLFSSKISWFERVKLVARRQKTNVLQLASKIVLGMFLLAVASNQIVRTTEFFAQVLEISPFFVGLVIVAFGTNIPEISIIFRSLLTGRNDIALADYLGSASANTLLFGVFTLMHGETINLPNPFIQRFFFLMVGLVLFFVFSRTKNRLSRKESLFLLSLYLIFLTFELGLVTFQN